MNTIKRLIGRKEKIDFPELSLFDIDAKIDTGAYTIALHCHEISTKEQDGKMILCFKVLDPLHPEYSMKEVQFIEFRKKKVKNSSGDFEERFIIKTPVKLGGRSVKTSISLTDRGQMRYPVLIGRKFLRNRFLIDVSKEHIANNKIAVTFL